jgi:hypothetical protein
MTAPHTVLVGGLHMLGTPLPPLQPKPRKRKAPMQKPAKPLKAKAKSEDYSTPYQPPAATATGQLKATLPKPTHPEPVGLEAFLIEDNVPIPSARIGSGKADLMKALLGKLQIKQSVMLDIANYAVVSKARTVKQKAGEGTFSIRKYPADGTLRVWRAA